MGGGISGYIFFLYASLCFMIFLQRICFTKNRAQEMWENRGRSAAWASGVPSVRPHTDLGQNGEGLRVQHQELLVLGAQHQAGHGILVSQILLQGGHGGDDGLQKDSRGHARVPAHTPFPPDTQDTTGRKGEGKTRRVSEMQKNIYVQSCLMQQT